jgi:thiamine pyrophosphokinase
LLNTNPIHSVNAYVGDFDSGSERAHAKPKGLYRQTNKQETNDTYMRSMMNRQEV